MYTYTVQFAYSQKYYKMKHEPTKGAGKNIKLKHKKILKWMDRKGVDSREDEEEKTTKRKEVKEMEYI